LKDSINDARQFALRLIRYRDRSEKEITERLKLKGFPDATVSATVQILKNSGLVDDASLAKSLEEIAKNIRLLGDRGISRFLKTRGINEDLIPRESLSCTDELERALKLSRKKMKILTQYTDEVRIKKLTGYLMRKGYSPDTIKKSIALMFHSVDEM
jgi:regulatory protein